MNFWETITGSDLTREWKAFEARAEALPADYQAAWEQIKGNLFPYAGFTGRNLMPIVDGLYIDRTDASVAPPGIFQGG